MNPIPPEQFTSLLCYLFIVYKHMYCAMALLMNFLALFIFLLPAATHTSQWCQKKSLCHWWFKHPPSWSSVDPDSSVGLGRFPQHESAGRQVSVLMRGRQAEAGSISSLLSQPTALWCSADPGSAPRRPQLSSQPTSQSCGRQICDVQDNNLPRIMIPVTPQSVMKQKCMRGFFPV